MGWDHDIRAKFIQIAMRDKVNIKTSSLFKEILDSPKELQLDG